MFVVWNLIWQLVCRRGLALLAYLCRYLHMYLFFLSVCKVQSLSLAPCNKLCPFLPPLTVCPAGWKPGSDTIIPDVEKSKAFFSKQ